MKRLKKKKKKKNIFLGKSKVELKNISFDIHVIFLRTILFIYL
jgi:hypothetical protein